MISLLLRVILNGFALWICTLILHGFTISTSELISVTNEKDTVPRVLGFLILGIIFALVNGLAKPIVRALSLPVTCLTLGLFSLVINAGMLYLTAWISSFTPAKLTIDTFFFTAILAAVIISVISSLGGALGGLLSKARAK